MKNKDGVRKTPYYPAWIIAGIFIILGGVFNNPQFSSNGVALGLILSLIVFIINRRRVKKAKE